MINMLKAQAKWVLSKLNLQILRINPNITSFVAIQDLIKEEASNGSTEMQVHKAAQVGTHKHLKALLEVYNINVVLDVGANKGQFAEMVLAMGFRGRVISFEPLKSAFNILRENSLHVPRWECYNYGISDIDSDARLYIYENDTFSSLYAPSDEGKRLFGTLIDETSQDSIKIKSLESIYSTLGLNAHDRILLKSDTQGHDFEVIRGCGCFLQQVDIIMTEASSLPIYQSRPTAIKILSFLLNRHFVVSGLYPFSFTPDLKLIELDMFFVRK